MKLSKIIFIFFSFLNVVAIYGQEIRKGPYLIYPNKNTEMTVLWQLTSTASCTINWGITTAYGSNQSVKEYGNDHQFKITLTNLLPNTKYFYKISFLTTELKGSFRTAPLDNSTNLEFFIYGDTRTYYQKTNLVTAMMLSEISKDANFQTFAIHTGDWTSAGQLENSWDSQFFCRTGSCENNLTFQSIVPIMGCRGNHENYSTWGNIQPATLFQKYFPYNFTDTTIHGDNIYYSFDYGPVHIAIVDQYYDNKDTGVIDAKQMQWLENDMKNTNKIWKFIVLHEPAWSASPTYGGHIDNVDAQRKIQPLCFNYKIQAVFCGHNHYYAHANVDGIHHFTLGGGGAPLYAPEVQYNNIIERSDEAYHFLKVQISGNSAILTAERPDGSVIEKVFLNSDISKNRIFSGLIYPNPAHTKLNINFDFDSIKVIIFDMNGRTCFNQTISSNQIDVSELASGIYTILIFNKREIITQRFVKF